MTGFILLGGALFVVFSWYMARNKSTVKQINWSNIYDADTPSFSGAPLDVRLIVLTPEVLAQAPDAEVFTSPLGREQGAFTYDAPPIGPVRSWVRRRSRQGCLPGLAVAGMGQCLGASPPSARRPFDPDSLRAP